MIDIELWPGILSWDNLLLAYRKARAGKSAQNEILRYGFNLEYELSHLRQALADHTYRPGPYRRFLVKDRKTRLISAAPFRDRVAQHALLNRLEPELDRLIIEDSYASRTGKGVHAAVRRYRAWANRYAYALKLDIRRYFDSIDHQRLGQKLACAISDPDVLWMFDRIIEASPPPAHPAPVPSPRDDLVDLMQRTLGLPLGNLTSQFLGNFYLNDLDHFVKDTLKVPAYLRYVDDMILLGDDKRHLWAWTAAIEEFLATERLGLHERKKRLVPVRKGLDVLGYQVFPNVTRLSRGSGYRFRRRTKALLAANAAGLCTDATLRCSVNGWLGHALQADTAGLRQALLRGGKLSHREGRRTVAGWFVAVPGTTTPETFGRLTATGTPPMKPTTTSVSASPVRPRTGRSRTVQGPAGRAAGAQGRPFPAAQDGQPKRWPWLAGGVGGPGCPRRRHPWRPLAAALVILALPCPEPAAARVKTRSTSPPVTQSASKPSPASDTAPPALPQRQSDACIEPGPDLAPTLVVLPPGRFWMGSPAGETGRDADEGPRQWVTIPRPFALGRCEVTVGQFRRFVEATGYRTQAEQPGAKGCEIWDSKSNKFTANPGRNWRDPGFPQTEAHPVTCVSHADAEAYLAWLSSRTGAIYRLPTEAEWEYAARAGSETAKYWGEDPQGQTQCAYANGAGQEAKVIGATAWVYAACRDDFVHTAPVASLRPNTFHLYDMSGNVWEWTADCWHDNYTGAPVDGSAWQETGGGDCGRRVVRGGSWYYVPSLLRSANRNEDTPDEANDNLGFRVARAL